MLGNGGRFCKGRRLYGPGVEKSTAPFTHLRERFATRTAPLWRPMRRIAVYCLRLRKCVGVASFPGSLGGLHRSLAQYEAIVSPQK